MLYNSDEPEPLKDRVEYWINELLRMEDQHYPELDHKDCGELAELLKELLEAVR